MWADVRWRVFPRGAPVQVAPFRDPAHARRHARKHYLDPAERWGDVPPHVSPPAPAPPEGGQDAPVLEAYLAAVRRCTEPARAIHGSHRFAARSIPDHPFPSLHLVSAWGVYVVFAEGDPVSHLATAYRPRGMTAFSGTGVAGFRDRALRKLAMRVGACAGRRDTRER